MKMITLEEAIVSNRAVIAWLKQNAEGMSLAVREKEGEEPIVFVADAQAAGQILQLTLETMGMA